MFKNSTNQQKGSLLAFVAVMLLTPDSLLIRLSNICGLFNRKTNGVKTWVVDVEKKIVPKPLYLEELTLLLLGRAI